MYSLRNYPVQCSYLGKSLGLNQLKIWFWICLVKLMCYEWKQVFACTCIHVTKLDIYKYKLHLKGSNKLRFHNLISLNCSQKIILYIAAEISQTNVLTKKWASPYSIQHWKILQYILWSAVLSKMSELNLEWGTLLVSLPHVQWYKRSSHQTVLKDVKSLTCKYVYNQ